MNAGMKLATVYVAGAILVAGCGQSNSGSAGTSPSQPAAASKQVAPKDASIKVKGLYIGMDIQTVPALLKVTLAGKDLLISDAKNASKHEADKSSSTENESFYGTILGLMLNDSNHFKPENFYVVIIKPGTLLIGIITAGQDGKVTTIFLSGDFVNALFNAADMDASAFVKQFISAYNIPEMKVSDDMQSWTYTSPNGEKVTIDTTKAVRIEKVASAQDRKQSFN